MYLNLNGVPVDLPLYAPDGTKLSVGEVFDGEQPHSFDANGDEELKQAQCLLKIVRRLVHETEQIGTKLDYIDENVNIYDEIGPDGEPTGDVYWSVTVGGGLNARGIWSNYFKSLSDLMVRMEAEFLDAWVITVDPDCPDDVFYVTIGIRTFKDQLDNDKE